MSDTEAGASWQQHHYVWGSPYVHQSHQHSHHPHNQPQKEEEEEQQQPQQQHQQQQPQQHHQQTQQQKQQPQQQQQQQSGQPQQPHQQQQQPQQQQRQPQQKQQQPQEQQQPRQQQQPQHQQQQQQHQQQQQQQHQQQQQQHQQQQHQQHQQQQQQQHRQQPQHQQQQQQQHQQQQQQQEQPQKQSYPVQYHQQEQLSPGNNGQNAFSMTQQQQNSIQNLSEQTPSSHQHQQYHQLRSPPNSRRQGPYESTGDPMITSSLKGKQGKDGPEEKKDADGELWGNVEAQAAFLGPNLWDKTLPYDADLKVLNHVCTKSRETYVDLDEFLSENGIPVDGVAGSGQGTMQSSQLHKINNGETTSHQGPAGLHLEPVTKRERSPSPSDCCSPDTLNPPSPADSTLSMASSGRDFDPRTRAFSDEELKPQPMIKKSRKQFVPDDLKDDKYWARRRKNNMAAKRSRDARRMKENQIALRAGFLEKENMGLRQELDRLKNENMLLRDKLSKYTDV